MIAAEDGHQAGQYFTDDLDLVIMDILMPRCDGLEAMQAMRTRSPDVKCIAISGGGAIDAEMYLRLATYHGAARALRKPVPRETLLAVVAEVLDSDPTVASRGERPGTE